MRGGFEMEDDEHREPIDENTIDSIADIVCDDD
jgi:hypothetical protein